MDFILSRKSHKIAIFPQIEMSIVVLTRVLIKKRLKKGGI